MSNNSTASKRASALRSTRVARIIGSAPTTPISRPPSRSCCNSACGTLATEPDSRITSNGASLARPSQPSASRTLTLTIAERRRFSAASRAKAGMRSSVTTLCARCASSAAMKPEPEPISSTRSWRWTLASCSSRASSRGTSMLWPSGSGNSVSQKARLR